MRGIPSKVRTLGMEIDVFMTNRTKDICDLIGQLDTDETRINLRSSANPEAQWLTLIHEVDHFHANVLGLTELQTNEARHTAISQAWFAFFRANPSIVNLENDEPTNQAKFPAEVNILGLNYLVERLDDVEALNDNLSLGNDRSLEIKICAGSAVQTQWRSLFLQVGAAINYLLGHQELNEKEKGFSAYCQARLAFLIDNGLLVIG